jgi:hypothetical protein
MAHSRPPLPYPVVSLPRRCLGRLNLQQRRLRAQALAAATVARAFLPLQSIGEIVIPQPEELKITTAREINADGVRRYLVWLSRGSATSLHSYAAPNAADAKRQAVEELQRAEQFLSSI